MGFTFQQPGSSSTLLAIGEAAQDAEYGLGVFAFASASGIQAFFDIPEVVTLLKAHKKFHLIVGVDAITNVSALLSIVDLCSKYGAHVLSAEAFFHEHPASTFHPKFVQFANGNKLSLVTGSGNLTLRGLGVSSVTAPPPGNWEAFSSETLTGLDAKKVLSDVDSWIQAYRANGMLRQLSDEEVKSRAMENGMVRFSTGKVPASGKKLKSGVPASGAAVPTVIALNETVDDDQGILIRELPKNRPGQADVGKSSLSEFFGYAGMPKYVLLQNVSLDDQLGHTESIRLFTNDSQNYRLELHALSALPYKTATDDSRMILVAIKLDERSFRYTVVPVDSSEHPVLLNILGLIPSGRRLMREKRISPTELLNLWADVPSNLIPVLSISAPI